MKLNAFYLTILSPERTFFDGAGVSLVVPTLDGLYGIQAWHEDVVLAVVPGTMVFLTEKEEEYIAAVSGGVLKMEHNRVLLLLDTVELADEIDALRAERAAAEAAELLTQKRSAQEHSLARQRMARAMSRMQTVKRKK